MDRRCVHRAIDSDDENTTRRHFKPNADFINVQQRREFGWILTTAETCNSLLSDCNAASSDLCLEVLGRRVERRSLATLLEDAILDWKPVKN